MTHGVERNVGRALKRFVKKEKKLKVITCTTTEKGSNGVFLTLAESIQIINQTSFTYIGTLYFKHSFGNRLV